MTHCKPADRTMAGDPENNISPGSPAFHYDSNNRPVFAHSTPIARRKMDVNISCAESVIPSSTFVLPPCPAPTANTSSVKISPSQDNVQMSQSPSRRECHQGQLFSPSGTNAFSTPPGIALSRFTNRTMLTPVKMIVCTNSKTRHVTNDDFGPTRNGSRFPEARVVYDSRQHVRERTDKKIRYLVNTSMQTGSNANVSVQTSFIENVDEDGKKKANGQCLEYSSVSKELEAGREVELRMYLEDWCNQHYIIDWMMQIMFLVLFVVVFVSFFYPLNSRADVILGIVCKM